MFEQADASVLVHVDAYRTRLVLTNLLRNALLAMPPAVGPASLFERFYRAAKTGRR